MEKSDIAEVEPQTLSDGSVAYNVRIHPADDDRIDIRIGCTSRYCAERLVNALNQCAWIDMT